MGRENLQNLDANWGHEPVATVLQNFASGEAEFCSAVQRFMESLLSFLRTHWDHEPWKARRASFQPAGSGGSPAAQVFCGQGCPQNRQPGWLPYERRLRPDRQKANSTDIPVVVFHN